MNKSAKDQIIIIIAFLLFFILGLYMIFWGVHQVVVRTFQMAIFDRVEGVCCDYDSKLLDSTDQYGHTGYSYTPIYSYMVNGKEYLCRDNVSYSNPPSTNKRETILYNPSDPSQSFVESDATFQGKAVPVGGIISVIASLLILSSLWQGAVTELIRAILFGSAFIVVGGGTVLLMKPITFPIILIPIVFIIAGLAFVILSIVKFVKWNGDK